MYVINHSIHQSLTLKSPLTRFTVVSQEARVVFNTGQAPDEQYFAFSPPAEVLGYENYYKT